MKFYLISDNIDTQIGMRLSGVEGEVVHTPEEAEAALEGALNDKEIGIILMTGRAAALCKEKVCDCKLNLPSPLIVEIPDRHADSGISEMIAGYLREAVGI